jgi:hypothetical protein
MAGASSGAWELAEQMGNHFTELPQHWAARVIVVQVDAKSQSSRPMNAVGLPLDQRLAVRRQQTFPIAALHVRWIRRATRISWPLWLHLAELRHAQGCRQRFHSCFNQHHFLEMSTRQIIVARNSPLLTPRFRIDLGTVDSEHFQARVGHDNSLPTLSPDGLSPIHPFDRLFAFHTSGLAVIRPEPSSDPDEGSFSPMPASAQRTRESRSLQSRSACTM